MTLRIGIVGTGWFSRVHADLLAGMEGVRVAAVCGTSEEKALMFASNYPGATGYSRFTEMLDSQKLDAVYLCIPPMAHGQMELELIDRAIPFFVEKPLSTNLQTPQDILDQLQKKPVVHAVGYHFRYKETIQRLKASLSGQTIGMVMGAWMGDMPQVAWWRKQEGSGGQFIEQTTHIVDLLRYTAGEVEEVYAAYGNRVVQGQYENVTVHDVGTVSMKLESGIIATVSNTCILPGGVGQVELRLYTNNGILDWSPDRLEISTPGVRTTYTGTDNPYAAEAGAFIHALRTGDTSRILSDYSDAYKTQTVTCAALESAMTGKPVRISE
ncbi:Gfo/Idh/MocA family protein [Paenibacillus puldeungensis]|uniref:Gfo/Idh/MocA family protein n=1 Tax=Paenibacillus puldeungensis TaxID=696536 RepID=A0ABW3S4D8_9BACL